MGAFAVHEYIMNLTTCFAHQTGFRPSGTSTCTSQPRWIKALRKPYEKLARFQAELYYA